MGTYMRSIAAAFVLVQALAASEPFDVAGREAHAVLTRLCDDFGGRLTGTVTSTAALERLAGELRAAGLQPEFSRFTMPGWERGQDTAWLVAPFHRPLRVTALAYTQPQPAFEADVVAIGDGQITADARGKIVVVSYANHVPIRELAALAVAHGVRGILQTDREAGGQLLARTGSFVGEALPLPIFSLTQEEGLWLQRLSARGSPLRVRMETSSRVRDVSTANLIVTLRGRSTDRVLVGAHFDSWDLGQGALDNGLGIAQLFALARSLQGRDLARTVELIWFNGEEQGLWGSRHAAEQLRDTPIVAMINLDMVGVPIAVNALGDESLVPALSHWNEGRGTEQLRLGVQNVNWFGSDHSPFQLSGVRTITFNAPIARDSVRYYHDFADTIDKLPVDVVVDSTKVIGDLVLALVNDSSLAPFRRSSDDTKTIFTKFGLERRMQAIGCWPFK